ncbi:MAG: hypothetical protein ACREF5_02900 [Candidatus Saccharimonadales bacterium]
MGFLAEMAADKAGRIIIALGVGYVALVVGIIIWLVHNPSGQNVGESFCGIILFGLPFYFVLAGRQSYPSESETENPSKK